MTSRGAHAHTPTISCKWVPRKFSSFFESGKNILYFKTLPFRLLLLAFFYLTAYCTLHCLCQSRYFFVLYLPIFDDYLKLPEFIVTGNKVEAPLTFSRNLELGFPVPYSWDYLPGTCMVHIDMDVQR